MAVVVAPNGKTYDLGDYNQRVQARLDNPAYVFTEDGYLLRGSGGAPSSDPSRGGNGNDGGTNSGRQVMPRIEGGGGTGSPSGYPASLPPVTLTNDALNQVQAAAAANTIASGPGGSYIYPIAQLVSGGVGLQEAYHRVLAVAQGAAADLSAGGSGLLGGSNNPSGGAPAPGFGGGTGSSSSSLILYGAIGLGLLLVLGGKH